MELPLQPRAPQRIPLSLHQTEIHLLHSPALLKRSILHKKHPSATPECCAAKALSSSSFLLKKLFWGFLCCLAHPWPSSSSLWHQPAAPQRVHGTISGKAPLLRAGEAREDTQMMLVCFPQLSFLSYKKRGILFPPQNRGKEEEAQLALDPSLKPLE